MVVLAWAVEVLAMLKRRGGGTKSLHLKNKGGVGEEGGMKSSKCFEGGGSKCFSPGTL